MEATNHHDDSSHYEISLTAGQAFISFVLLLFSLAAAFAFGVIVGKGQFEDSTVAQNSPIAKQARIVELADETKPRDDAAATAPAPVIIEEDFPREPAPASNSTPRSVPKPPAPVEGVPHFAQLLSTTDARAAESLAAKLIEGGFDSAFVERSKSPRGVVHRVRVTFPSEQDARRAVNRLRNFAAGEIWITRQ